MVSHMFYFGRKPAFLKGICKRIVQKRDKNRDGPSCRASVPKSFNPLLFNFIYTPV